ncbi:MAG: hypothetical protein FVQ83_01765 [Chloroflexi bacterium]|nr:hypothetical protein [Chloroflexota bacterium]
MSHNRMFSWRGIALALFISWIVMAPGGKAAPLLAADAYEPDNSSGQATWINPGNQQTHNIEPVGDEDWVKFYLYGSSKVLLETSGPGGDTVMWLYNSSLTLVEYDDNDGTNFFSKIDRWCGIDALPIGTYYLKIEDNGDDSLINSYNIDLTISPCQDSYEPDNNSGQASWIYNGLPQDHTISPVGDEDWVKFNITIESYVLLQTNGPSGNTRMWLYTSGLALLEYNDDGGAFSFSRIDRICDVDSLTPGTYYAKIDEFSDSVTIDWFTISLTIISCGGPPADFDANGTTDVSVFRPSNGRWYTSAQGFLASFGTSGDIPVPQDYDGDGYSDIVVYRPSNGRWYFNGGGNVGFGIAGDIPMPCDYEGDGRAQIAVYRPSNGRWYVKDDVYIAYGIAGDIPVPGDYDGDGDCDYAIYRPSNGRWYIKDQGYWAYGIPGDIPVPGDYDGDGDFDVAIYRPSNGRWYVLGQGYVAYGIPGDIPVPGDYDGDGDWDETIYRPSNGRWYKYGIGYEAYGIAGDYPLPARDTNIDGDPHE